MKNLALTITLLLGPTLWATTLTTTATNEEKEVLLADSMGRTLYVFDLDLDKATPQCTGNCSDLWPAYILAPEEVGTLAAPLGTITRASGKIQLTYQGRPVYVYGFDRVAGDDKGDGIGGVWHYVKLN